MMKTSTLTLFFSILNGILDPRATSQVPRSKCLVLDGKVIGCRKATAELDTCSRKCPGQYIAHESVWASVVSVLATLRIEKAKDDHGNDIEFTPEFTGGLARCVSSRNEHT